MSRDVLNLLKIIENYKCQKRNYESFYDWPDKKIKEAGIVEAFLDSKNNNGIHEYVNFSTPEKDPPDAVIYKINGEEAQLELTELVNKKAIEFQIKNNSKYQEESFRWTDRVYFEKQLNKIIQTKNKKCEELFNQNPNVQLLLHSDEMWIESSYKEHFETGISIEPHRFSSIWLILSYSPQTGLNEIIPVSKHSRIRNL